MVIFILTWGALPTWISQRPLPLHLTGARSWTPAWVQRFSCRAVPQPAKLKIPPIVWFCLELKLRAQFYSISSVSTLVIVCCCFLFCWFCLLVLFVVCCCHRHQCGGVRKGTSLCSTVSLWQQCQLLGITWKSVSLLSEPDQSLTKTMCVRKGKLVRSSVQLERFFLLGSVVCWFLH